MRLYIAGGCSEHGRNSFLLTGEKVRILVDAGRMKEKPDEPFPLLDEETIAGIDYLFLTHSHTDHTGAISFLAERGFHGRIVASRATLEHIGPLPVASYALEDIGEVMKELHPDPRFSVLYGRAGHCIGSVWYELRLDGRAVLFTGDYEERSLAYRCDAIRERAADVAVIDCAYGTEREDADEHFEALRKLLDRLVEKGAPMLFPVPSHGRGFDLVRLLAERGVTVVLAASLVEEFRNSLDRAFWLREEFQDAVMNVKNRDIGHFEEAYRAALALGLSFPDEYRHDAILVRDSQLVKNENRQIALGVASVGGCTILTGKQDPASYARALLNCGDAVFCRISVHQNIKEMLRLKERNHFRITVPYHCREPLAFDEPDIRVLAPGDALHF